MTEPMEAASSEEQPAPPGDWREVRLALVLYGGVSMAIYMYGVVYEIWRALRASQSIQQGTPDLEDPWVKVLKRVERRVTVDIVSGASAGGINGILLGRALACGANLEPAKDVWLKKADLMTLMARGVAKPKSLLKSDVFEGELKAAFEVMGADPEKRLIDVLDVFVSTTHLGGDVREFTDSLDHKLATKRHNVPVRLRFRSAPGFASMLGVPIESSPGEATQNDFDDEALLVQLARATSAFPVAFEPVHRTGSSNPEWPEGHYTDGGVTDNKPFEQALETVFGRAAERPVDRWVLSINPDPEKAPTSKPDHDPDFLDVVAAATFAIPRYESVQQDLDRLEDHRAKVESYWDRALNGLEASIADGSSRGVSDALYAGLRHMALSSFLADELLRARRDSPRMAERWTPPEAEIAISGLLPAAELEWKRLDTAFEVRRAYYVIKLLGKRIKDGPEGAVEPLIAARRVLWRRFEHVRSATRTAVEKLLSSDIAELDLEALARGVAMSAEEEGALVSTLAGLAGAGDAFTRYEERDRALLAWDQFGYRVQRDELDYAQIDPSAAHALDDFVPPEQRLAGEVLGHFGGFLEERWRENDILWGRLDAADVLVGALAKSSGLSGKREMTASVQGNIVADALKLKDENGWQDELVKCHPAGGEDIGDISGERLSGLALTAGEVAQHMFQSLSTEGRRAGAGALRLALKPLGSAFFRVLSPLLFLLGRAIGKGKGLTRLGAGVLLVPAAGGAGWVALKALSDNRVDFAIFVAGLALSYLSGLIWKRKATAGMGAEP